MHLPWQDDDDLPRADSRARALARRLQALETFADDERVRLGEEGAGCEGLR